MGHSPATENRPKINKDDYEGMFLLAEIGGIAVNCLIDTGASLSTIHPALYNRMTEKPLLSQSDVRLRMADGSLGFFFCADQGCQLYADNGSCRDRDSSGAWI